jgi:hypothetical protein
MTFGLRSQRRKLELVVDTARKVWSYLLAVRAADLIHAAP